MALQVDRPMLSSAAAPTLGSARAERRRAGGGRTVSDRMGLGFPIAHMLTLQSAPPVTSTWPDLRPSCDRAL